MTREELLEHVLAMERQESELRAKVNLLTATVTQQSDIINQSQLYDDDDDDDGGGCNVLG